MTHTRACKAAEIFDDPASAALLAEYAKECAIALLGKPAPRRDAYENLEASGFGQCFGAYEGEQLRGFAFVLMAVVPHYGLSHATVESLFVTRAARAVGLGTELMKIVEEYARRNGCAAVFYSAPVRSRLASLMFLYEDEYQHTNHVFCRSLQPGVLREV